MPWLSWDYWINTSRRWPQKADRDAGPMLVLWSNHEAIFWVIFEKIDVIAFSKVHEKHIGCREHIDVRIDTYRNTLPSNKNMKHAFRTQECNDIPGAVKPLVGFLHSKWECLAISPGSFWDLSFLFMFNFPGGDDIRSLWISVTILRSGLHHRFTDLALQRSLPTLRRNPADGSTLSLCLSPYTGN